MIRAKKLCETPHRLADLRSLNPHPATCAAKIRLEAARRILAFPLGI
jgi:hypothetical protein